MTDLTKGHIQGCLNQAINKLNKEGRRTPWFKEVITVLSPEDKWQLDMELNDVSDSLTSIDWIIVLQTELYGIEGGLALALSETMLTDVKFDPYEYLVINWIDDIIRSKLKYCKDLSEGKFDEDDDYEEAY